MNLSNKKRGLAIEQQCQNLTGFYLILLTSQQVGANKAKGFDSPFGAEAAGDLQLNLGHAEIRFTLVIRYLGDGPDNYLDLDSRQLLESALWDYPDSFLLVSHDPVFVEAVGINGELAL